MDSQNSCGRMADYQGHPACHEGLSWRIIEGERLTCVLSAETFSPHETHFCVLGSGVVGLDDLIRSRGAPRSDVAWYWRVLFVCLFAGLSS